MIRIIINEYEDQFSIINEILTLEEGCYSILYLRKII